MGAREGSLQQAQAMASVIRGKLAGETFAVMIAAEQGDRAGILIYSRVEQQVVAQLSCDEECEQMVAYLHEQEDEHEVSEEATARHGNQTVQEKPDDELAC